MLFRRLVFFNLFGFMLTACGIATFAGTAESGNGKTERYSAPTVDGPAPNFELDNLDGAPTRLEDLRGQVVILNFWATWCPPCRFEMPTLQSTFESYDPNITILAINFAEQEDVVKEFVGEFDLTFPVLLDSDGAVQELYQVRGYPSSVFIDADGIIQIIHIGIMTEDQLEGYLVELGVGDR